LKKGYRQKNCYLLLVILMIFGFLCIQRMPGGIGSNVNSNLIKIRVVHYDLPMPFQKKLKHIDNQYRLPYISQYYVDHLINPDFSGTICQRTSVKLEY
jgi:hypothetical protein